MIHHHFEQLVLAQYQTQLFRLAVNVRSKYSRRWEALSVSHVAVHDSDGGRAAGKGKLSTSESIRLETLIYEY
jgi:hypothetical protein